MGGLLFRFAQFLYPEIPSVKLVEVPTAKRRDIPQDGVRPVRLPQGSAMIVDTGGQLRAFSAVCTHLGCLIAWHEDVKKFVCPCHNGIFDRNGKVLSGPPPRSLEEIKTIVRGDDVFLLVKSRQEIT